MLRPAIPRSLIPRPLSAMAGRDHPAPGALSQDRSCRSAAKTSATGKVDSLSMGTALALHALLGHMSGAKLIPVLPLVPVATTGRRTPLLLASPVRLKKPVHNPRGPLILMVDSILSGASHPAHLGQHAPDVELATDPSEGSHHPIKLVLVLRAVSPRPSVLTQGLECLPCQVGDLLGMVDCSLFPVGSGLFLQL
jgi:hypothetical protein